MDIGWQRGMPFGFQIGFKRFGEMDDPPGTIQRGGNFRFRAIFQEQAPARVQPFSTHQGLPGGLIQAAQEQQLHPPTRGELASIQPSRDDACFIHHQDISSV